MQPADPAALSAAARPPAGPVVDHTRSIPVGDGITSADTMDCPLCQIPTEAAPR